ncbi:hypothetical protein ACHAXR_004435 [Thalassiosira sp. AJA248-18]
MDGNGTYTFANRDVYEGEFQSDNIHGNGTMKYASGAVYKGSWAKDDEHGTGTMKDASGAVYKGGWVKGKKHGTGTLKEVNRAPIQVVYNHGKRMSSKRILPVKEGPPPKRPCTNKALLSAKAKSIDKDTTMPSPVLEAEGINLEEEPSTPPDVDFNTQEDQKDDEEARSAKARSDHNTAGKLSHVSEAEGVTLEEESPTQSAVDPDTHDDEIDGEDDGSSCSSTKGYYHGLCERILAKNSWLTAKICAQRAEIESLKQELANEKRQRQDI